MVAISDFGVCALMFLFLMGVVLVNGFKLLIGTSGGQQLAGSLLSRWFGS